MSNKSNLVRMMDVPLASDIACPAANVVETNLSNVAAFTHPKPSSRSDVLRSGSSTAHSISAMRLCRSSGGRSNSCSFSVFQLIVGESEPTEISTARFMKRSLIIRNGKNSGSTTSGFALTTIACAEQIPSNYATASLRW
jgi:hypothetical protein